MRDNAVDKTTETRTIPAGELTKQAVSVAVNADKVKVPSRTPRAIGEPSCRRVMRQP